MQYTGRVLLGHWFERFEIESELQEKQDKIRAMGQLPHQRLERAVEAFNRPVPVTKAPSTGCGSLRFGQRLQLTCPRILDRTYRFEDSLGCPDEDFEYKNPHRYGLYLAATISHFDVDKGVDGIEDGCGVACSPDDRPIARSIFAIEKAEGRGCTCREDCLRFGQPFYLRLTDGTEVLYLRSEPPLVDGQFGPREHFPVRLSTYRNCYAKWRVLHCDHRRRLETDGQPVPATARVIVQHVMTGQCLTTEHLVWHRSLLGFESGVSVHTYTDRNFDEGCECIWSFVPFSEKTGPDQERANDA